MPVIRMHTSDRLEYIPHHFPGDFWEKPWGETPGHQKTEKEQRTMGKKNVKTTQPLKIIEPVTKVIEEGRFFRILTELPDIAEEKIKIDLENHATSVTIVAVNTVKEFKKVITIPCEVRFTKKRFSDGILEITLEKTTPAPL